MHPKDISILDFTYDLPDERIASYPSPERDASRLLVYDHGKITETVYRNIAGHLPENALLIFNNTKVVEARILFQKQTGAFIEIFCLEPAEGYPDISTAMAQKETVRWKCLIGGASKWKKGQILEKKIESADAAIILRAAYIEKQIDSFIIEFSWQPVALSFAEILHYAGLIPLPPYIKRAAERSDAERYQTIYARQEGSVAAPTAGLHFTDGIFSKLDEKNIRREFVTLHVGAGTFKPVKSETLETHEMHREFIEVSVPVIEKIIDRQDCIIPVGTTSLRTIESLYWLGLKTILHPQIPVDSLALNQWDAYELPAKGISTREALQSLLDSLKQQKLNRLIAGTQLLIAPGYSFKVGKGLITNFHQPGSTLLLLVAALIGDDWKKVYQYALNNQFRFLSYGDGCLLLPA